MLNHADLFTMANLTAFANKTPLATQEIGALFKDNKGITTKTAVIDQREGELTLIPAKPVGGTAHSLSADTRGNPIALFAEHYPQDCELKASEIQGLRKLGSDRELETIESKRNEMLLTMNKNHALTLEHQRAEAIKGVLTNVNGASIDLFAQFGVTQIEVDTNLDNATAGVQSIIMEAIEASEDHLSNLTPEGFTVLCGKNYFKSLINHAEIRDSYRDFQNNHVLQDDVRNGFYYAGATFKKVKGKVEGVPLIGDDEAYLCPLVDIYSTRFAPGDFAETVNTEGLPVYSVAEPLPFNKGIKMWSESNPISFVKRPGAVIKLHRNTAAG